MASTKYDIASAALILIGADPVTSFDSAGSTEQIACYHLYQSCVDHWLSLFPWRFATKNTLLSREVSAPLTMWSASYAEPAGMKALQALVIDTMGTGIPFDRFQNKIHCDAGATTLVYAVHTYEPAVTYWPGYFVSLMEVALAAKLSFALAAKIDLKNDYSKDVETYFRLAKNADSRQQTNRQLPVSGRGSLLEARRS